MNRALIYILLLGLVTACGGSGGSDGNPVPNADSGNETPTVPEDETPVTPTPENTATPPPVEIDPPIDGDEDEPLEDESNNDPDQSDAILSADEFNKRIINESFDVTSAFPSQETVYQSSNDSIATVTANGWVNVHQAGEVTITSSIAEESSKQDFEKTQTTHFESSKSQTGINIIVKDPEFNFKSWVGEYDTILDFNDSLFGLTLFTGGGRYCAPITEENCNAINRQIISNENVIDQTSTLSTPGFHHFTFGNNQAGSSALSAEKFEVRSGEATIVFKEQLYLIGGYTTGDVNNSREYKNDIWVSKDGDEWLELAEEAEFSPRSGHQLIIHENRMWLMGGSNRATLHNDVWVSEDGITWAEVNQNNRFNMRSHFELFMLNGNFYIAGGYTTNGEQLSDLWRSEDSVNWTAVPNFEYAQANNTPVVVIGEANSQTALLFGDKTYSSSDGLSWTEIDDAPIFTGFDNREAALINDEIWLFTYTFEYFGTRGRKNISRVYKSSDGLIWNMVNGGIYLGNLIAREAKPIAFKERLYIIGGRAEILEYTNEVWSTTDTELWVEHTTGGFYGSRHSHAMTSHNGKLYSSGGIASDNISTASAYKSDIWSSEDGLNWSLVEDAHPTFRARGGHTLLSAGNKLCYVGGKGRLLWGTASGYRHPFTVQEPDPAGSVLHVILFEVYGVFGDIACSIDGGIVWHEVVPNTDEYFDERSGSASVYFNNKLWVIGGSFNSTFFNDVWSSDSTDNWDEQLDRFTYGAYFTEFTEVTNNAAFSPRTGHAVTIHNNELYLSAGKNSEGFYLDDLWKTSDGENWTQVNEDMGEMHKRAFHQMVSFNNKLWIIAGRANYHETLVHEDTTVYEANDIWVSEDNGLTWEEVTENAVFEQRQNFQAVVHDESLFLTGGTGGDGYVTVQGKDSIHKDVWRTEDGSNWRTGLYKTLKLIE